jgi:hypothetical protein
MFRPHEMVGHLMVQAETMEFQFVFLQLVHYSIVVVILQHLLLVHQLLLLLLQLLLHVHQLLLQLLQILLPFIGFSLLLLVHVAYEDIPYCCVLLVCILSTSTHYMTSSTFHQSQHIHYHPSFYSFWACLHFF